MTNSLVQRYEKARASCALFHLEDWAAIEISGPDGRDFLQRLSTQDLRPLQPGSASQTLFLSGDGRLIADAIVLCAASDKFLLLTPRLCRENLMGSLDRFHFSENLTMSDRTEAFYIGMVTGPHREQLVHKIKDLSEQNDADIFYATASIAPASERSFIAIPLSAFTTLRTALYGALEAEGGVVGGADLYETVRIEEGIPAFGHDLSEKTIPLESNQKPAISFTKGCFPGQEIVARINNLGHPANVLVGLVLPETTESLAGRELVYNEKTVGRITSTCFSPSTSSMLGLGYVKWNQREPGIELVISGEGAHTAKVMKLPLPGLAAE